MKFLFSLALWQRERGPAKKNNEKNYYFRGPGNYCSSDYFPRAGAAADKVAKIGLLAAGSVSGTSEKFFGRDLRALGYVEGKHIVVENRSAENKLDRLPVLAEELVRLNVDVLVTSATSGAMALKNATRTIPIVFFIAGDPVEAGLVDSLPKPGGNITGFTNIAPVLAGKRLELLKETVPKLTRVALLWDPRIEGPNNRGKKANWRDDNSGCSFIPWR